MTDETAFLGSSLLWRIAKFTSQKRRHRAETASPSRSPRRIRPQTTVPLEEAGLRMLHSGKSIISWGKMAQVGLQGKRTPDGGHCPLVPWLSQWRMGPVPAQSLHTELSSSLPCHET